MPVKLVFVFCALIEKENLGLGLCTVIDIMTPGGAFGLGEKSDTIWTNQFIENCGNHWGIHELYLDHSGPPGDPV